MGETSDFPPRLRQASDAQTQLVVGIQFHVHGFERYSDLAILDTLSHCQGAGSQRSQKSIQSVVLRLGE